jgi:ribokinase
MRNDAILVVGSANMDLVVKAHRFPVPGETMLGGAFGMFPGGKGANQAVACAKLGGNVSFLGNLGRDVFGDKLKKGMHDDGVNVARVRRDPLHPTGIALITVDADGQNEIIVASGSNMTLRPADMDRDRSLFTAIRVLLLQLEIPVETVVRAARIAHAQGAEVILNPAPARSLPYSLLRLVDFLTPNETELGQLTDTRISGKASIREAARKLLRIGVRNVLVTMGSNGCLLVNDEVCKPFPARRVKAVDTTAAGDAFNGALAVSLARGETLEEAIPFASDVAACSVTRMGAQSSMPTMREVKRFRKGDK